MAPKKAKPKKTKPTNVEEYIASAPKEVQKRLRELRACIRAAAPGSKENLKWGMPAYSYKRILVTFKVFKKHIGFYPTPPAVAAFANDLMKYKKASASIQFPLDKPLPLTLIGNITSFRVQESIQEDKKWRT